MSFSFKHTRKGLIAACIILALSVAHADVQTWRLMGVVDPDSGTPGAGGLSGDDIVQLDYLLDTAATYDARFGEFTNLVRSVSVNGGPSFAASSSYLSVPSGAAFLSAHFSAGQSGAPQAITFGHADDLGLVPDVSTALSRLSEQLRNRDELTLDFGGSGIAYVIPVSFSMLTAVPEPDGIALALLSLGALAARARRRPAGRPSGERALAV
jgi:MYXO-CTERM domain-containing protein